MSHPRPINVAYPENQLTQRFFASRSLQGKLLEFYLSDGTAVKGFITGLDDDNLQICALPNLAAMLLSTNHLAQVCETGKTIEDLAPQDIEKARKYTKIFRRISEKELSLSNDED